MKFKTNKFMRKLILFFLIITLIFASYLLFYYNSKKKSALEIEKKFIVKLIDIPLDLANSKNANKYIITQSYISFSPEIRLRKVISDNNNRFYITIKIPVDKFGMIREEYEYAISESKYNFLLKFKEGNTIEKTRYQFMYNKKMFAVDKFNGFLNGLVVAEVEFDSEDETKSFIPPKWLGKDITSNKKYKNGNLSKYGIPTK